MVGWLEGQRAELVTHKLECMGVQRALGVRIERCGRRVAPSSTFCGRGWGGCNSSARSDGTCMLPHTRPPQLLSGVDKTFAIEVAAMKFMHNEGGLAMMRQRILDCLASEVEHIDLDHSLQLLQKTKSSNIYAIGNGDVKGVTDSVLEILQTMRTGGSPNVKHMAGNAFMQKAPDCVFVHVCGGCGGCV